MDNPKRIMIDISDFYKQKEDFLSVTGFKDDLSVIELKIKGPVDSPFEGGVFDLELKMPKDYPASPPIMTCSTPVWHPNISDIGTVCMNILNVDWKEGCTLIECAEGFRSLLVTPNPDSPLNTDAADMLNHYPGIYHQNATLWTKVLAGGKTDVPELEEKMSILMALGLKQRSALMKGSLANWDMEAAVEDI